MNIESLELRRLLSVTLEGQDVTITGSDGADVITINVSASELIVTENGTPNQFPLASVKTIHADLRAGNDSVSVANRVGISAWLAGGPGNDTLLGGGGSDTLLGGEGNDLLSGGRRGDVLSGGDGKDTCSYTDRTAGITVILNDRPDDGAAGERDDIGSDIEIVRGGSGNDRLVGNAHSNRLFGNGGNDTLTGGRANDVLDGGDGNDLLLADPGDDTLIGGAGNDVFLAASIFDGHDSLSGGDGIDKVDYHARTIAITIGGSGSEDLIDSIESVIGGQGGDHIQS